MINKIAFRLSTVFLFAAFLISATAQNNEQKIATLKSNQNFINFSYSEITGIGRDSFYNRRDNSDIIKVGDTYYIWYSRMNRPITSGYWATIWYATSKDEGHNWQEQGKALGLGAAGEFDSHSVFSPNILAYKGKYYLYYTGVKPTPGNTDNEFENNATSDFTAFGLAVAENPDGPFVRLENNPVLKISNHATAFDSYRIDDACLLIKNNKIWLYYKGRSMVHGNKGAAFTQMGVAKSNMPEGPFEKNDAAVLEKSHEVLLWKKNKGVAALASISHSINYAEDGIHFAVIQDSLTNIPQAPGLYRPDLENGNDDKAITGWGIAMKGTGNERYLIRFQMK